MIPITDFIKKLSSFIFASPRKQIWVVCPIHGKRSYASAIRPWISLIVYNILWQDKAKTLLNTWSKSQLPFFMVAIHLIYLLEGWFARLNAFLQKIVEILIQIRPDGPPFRY